MLESPDQDSIAKLARKVSMTSDKSAYTGPFLSRNCSFPICDGPGLR